MQCRAQVILTRGCLKVGLFSGQPIAVNTDNKKAKKRGEQRAQADARVDMRLYHRIILGLLTRRARVARQHLFDIYTRDAVRELALAAALKQLRAVRKLAKRCRGLRAQIEGAGSLSLSVRLDRTLQCVVELATRVLVRAIRVECY